MVRPLPTPPSSPGLAQRKASFTQPEIDESVVTVRRISTNPAQADTIQRVNSIGSILVSAADASSDALPLGGRKSSIGSTLTLGEIGYIGPMICVGDRRPSADDLPQENGSFSIRRVSAGGVEDVVSIMGPHQQLGALVERTVAFKDDGEEVGHSAALPGPSGITHSPRLHFIPQLPKMEAPPVTALTHRRPDSIDITLAAKPSLRSAPTTATPRYFDTSPKTPKGAKTPDAVDTAVSHTAVKSPWTGLTIDTSAGIVFQAWRGFPTANIKDEEDVHRETKHGDQEECHTLGIASGQEPNLAIYDLNQAKSSPKPVVMDVPSIEAVSSHNDIQEKVDQSSLAVRPLDQSTAPAQTSPHEMPDQAAPQPPVLPALQITSPIDKATKDSSIAPTVSASPSPSSSPRNQKVTYLADLVTENKTRATSNPPLASLVAVASAKSERPRSAHLFSHLHLPGLDKRRRSLGISDTMSEKHADQEISDRHGRLANLMSSMRHKHPHKQESTSSHEQTIAAGTRVTGLKPPGALHRSRSALELNLMESCGDTMKRSSLDFSRSREWIPMQLQARTSM